MSLTPHQLNQVFDELVQRMQVQEPPLTFTSPGAPTWVVANALTLVQQRLPASEDPLPDVETLYKRVCQQQTAWTENVIGQSWAAASGSSFQGFVRGRLQDALNASGIRAVSAAQLAAYGPAIRSFLTLPARRRCVQASFEAWPDNDIMLLTRSEGTSAPPATAVKVFGILSCKTSFHARETESCFWALATRDTGVRMGLVTQDRSRELGSCQHPTKARMLLEAYFDRVFVTNPHTSACAQIRPFDEIYQEVRRWRLDVVPDAIDTPWP